MEVKKYFCDICKTQIQDNQVNRVELNLNTIDVCQSCFEKINHYIMELESDFENRLPF